MLQWIKRRAEMRKDGRLAIRMTVWIEAKVYDQFVRTVVEGRKRSHVITEMMRKMTGNRSWLDEVLNSPTAQSTEMKEGKASTRKAAKARKTTREKSTVKKTTRGTPQVPSSGRARQSTIPPASAPPSAPSSRTRPSAPPPGAAQSNPASSRSSKRPTTESAPPNSVRNSRTLSKTHR